MNASANASRCDGDGRERGVRNPMWRTLGCACTRAARITETAPAPSASVRRASRLFNPVLTVSRLQPVVEEAALLERASHHRLAVAHHDAAAGDHGVDHEVLGEEDEIGVLAGGDR